MMKRLVVIVLLAVWRVKAASDPCDTVNVLPSIRDRSTSHVMEPTDTFICDDVLAELWYLMEDYDMPLQPQSLYSCGTLFPIWLNATIPNADGREHKLAACGATHVDSCFLSIEILVKNCGIYRVYYLKTLSFCDFAYCFDPVIDINNDPAPEFKQNLELKLNDALPDDTSLVFRCEFETVDALLFYTFSWFMDDLLIKKNRFLDAESLADHHLHEDDITEKDVNIRCGVQASVSRGGYLSPIQKSSNLYIGIVIQTPDLIIERTDTKPIQVVLRPSVPIRGHHLYPNFKFRISQVRTFNKSVCPNWDVKLNQRCSQEVLMDDWNKTITFDISIAATIGNNIGGTSRILRLKIPEDPIVNSFWHNYELKNIWVHYSDGSSIWKNKECYAKVDPHMKNFEGRRYECQSKGEFVMYVHLDYPLEVQMKSRSCYGNNKSPYCVCAVAIRAGRDVFVMSTCSSLPFVGMLSCNDGLLDVREVTSDSSYKIFLPTGTIVNVYKIYGGLTHLNVHIIPSPRDIGKTSGLCGVLSGKTTDDFCLRDDITNCQNSAVNFYDSWRVPQSDSLFDPTSDILSTLPIWEENIRLCVCPFNSKEQNTIPNKDERDQADCSNKQYNECSLNGLNNLRKRTFKCTITNNNNILRKRREAVRRMRRSSEHRYKRSEGSETATEDSQDWTEEAAAAYCSAQMEKSSTYRKCVETQDVDVISALAECATDIMLTNTTTWVMSSLESIRRACSYQIQMNNTVVIIDEDGKYVANEIDDYNPGFDIENSYCPYDCHGHGTCNNGTCICDENYGDGDCYVDVTIAPPTYDIFNDGLCDNSDMECDEISLYGDNYVDSNNLTCRVLAYELTSLGDISEKQIQFVTGEYISRYEVSCLVPVIGNEKDIPFVSAYDISISNIGEVFGQTWTLYVYNGRCIIEDNMSFSQNDKCCYIGREFYSIQDINMNNNSQICDPRRSKTVWSDKPDTDKCLSDTCPDHSTCANSPGSYTCKCNDGYSKDGLQCIDTDECLVDTCPDHSICANSPGSYTCNCNDGYSKDGLQCIDTDECSSDICPAHSTCANSPGSYTCTCNAGYRSAGLHCIETKSFELTMKLDAKGEWKKKGDTKYMSAVEKLNLSITSYYTQKMVNEFLGLTIIEIRHGSIDVEHVVYLKSSETATAVMMATLVFAVREPNALEYNGQFVNVSSVSTVNVNDESVTLSHGALDDGCKFFTALEPCPAKMICSMSVDGTFHCIQNETGDYFGSGTIIAVSVTSAIILVAICILMFVFIRKRVAKAEFRRNCDTETPHSVNDFQLVKHDGQTAWRHDNGGTGGRQGHRRRSNDYDHDANND